MGKYALPIGSGCRVILYGSVPLPIGRQRRCTLAYPGIDLVLPYWMGRQCGVIPTGEETTGAKP